MLREKRTLPAREVEPGASRGRYPIIMNIDAASASAVSADRLSTAVGVKVARKAMDMMDEQGKAAVALIQAAAKVQEATQSQAGGLDVTA